MEEGFAIWANPSSPHAEGRKARNALEDARARVKDALGWNGELIFTSGASEALAIGLGQANASRQLVSAVEHDAVFRAAPDAQELPVGADGAVDRQALIDALSETAGKPVVAIQHINSETGTVQPVVDYSAIVREAGGMLLSDCSQSAGKITLPDADMLVISAHKFGGPIGIGALLVKDYAMLRPTGGHERGYRQGTENLPGALGMAAALEAAGQASKLEVWATSDTQRREFADTLAQHGAIIAPGERCSHIIALSHPTISAQALLIRLDAMGFAVSAGSACSSGTLKQSRALTAFGIAEDVAARTIRVSLGWNTTPQDLERFAKAWVSLS